MPRPRLLLSLLMACPAAAFGQAPKPSSCAIQPDKAVRVTLEAGRVAACALDLGSRNVKLSVVSLVPGRDATVREERQCRRNLGMGALVHDSRSGTSRALPEEAIAWLVETLREYLRICALDRGEVVAAGATQWARNATNIAEVRARVKAEANVEFDVLTHDQEAAYGYVAASVNTPGRLVLDPGSNSFQISWQERGSPAIRSILVEHGYVRGAMNDVEPAPDFAAGRARYQERTRARIEEQLGRLAPPMSLVRLRRLVEEGAIGPELLALGQDGAVHLSVRGLLRATNGDWIAEPAAYDEAVARQKFLVDPSFGVLTAEPLRPAELQAYLDGIRPADFERLTRDPVRSLYGQKALVVPALVDLLFRELGTSRLVMVPQEITTGHILAKRARATPR